ncbi:glycosyltransferase family 4 protein [Pleurocapsales cyanobacterium LEGE 06147]|nr:glycosyltransferase family 4 protein [Pleurocapsales cyanobacterium LEGE 06147]
MKILLFGTISGQGGIQSHLRWLAKALVKSQQEVLIITPQPLTNNGFNWDEANNIGVQVHQLNSDQFKSSNYLTKTIIQLRELAQVVRNFNPDVYFGVGTSWYLSLLPWLFPKKTRSVFHEVMPGLGGRWRDSRWGVKWWFDDVVGQSSCVALNFAENFRWSKPVPAIPEPLEITAKLPQPTVKKVEFGTAKAALFSRLVPWKKALWLVQQWNDLKDVLGELHIHGTGPEEALIKEYIEAQGIGDRVKCFGYYPEGQVYVDLLSSYDLTLLPTVGPEGTPLVLLESMACGVPFVAYGVGGIPDYGIDNPNVIVVPPEPWLTDQAREYAVGNKSQKTTAFMEGIKRMAHKLARGEINQVQLQQLYLEKYSYEVLKKAWLSYLCDK